MSKKVDILNKNHLQNTILHELVMVSDKRWKENKKLCLDNLNRILSYDDELTDKHINDESHLGKTALMISAEYGRQEMFDILLKRITKISIDHDKQ